MNHSLFVILYEHRLSPPKSPSDEESSLGALPVQEGIGPKEDVRMGAYSLTNEDTFMIRLFLLSPEGFHSY